MSGANNGKPSSDNHPPPPPGGPPSNNQGKPAPSQIPAYNPAAPTFAAPPSRADSDIYNAPDDETPPPMPTRPGHGHPMAGSTGTAPAQAPAAHAGGKSKFSLSSFGQKLTGGINQLANKMGSEGFLPDSLDVECEKAARTLRAFCKEGLDPETAAEAPPQTLDVPPDGRPTSSGKASPDPKADKRRKSKTLVHIPSKAFSRAVGLAIFTNARAAYFVTGSIGSGVLISRLPNGGWSAPAGIHVRIGGVGAAAGADIFDCVVIFSNRETLDIFTRTGSITLGGGGVSLAAGPWGAGGNFDFAASDSANKGKGKGKEGEAGAADASHPVTGDKPAAAAGSKLGQPLPSTTADGKQRSRSPLPGSAVISYVRSRGLYGGVQVDGTVLSERKNENARFYNQEGITVAQILSKDVAETASAAATHPWQKHAQILLDTVRSAEGYRTGSGPSTPLDPPTTLMNNVRLDGDNSAAAPSPAAPVGDSKVGAPQSISTTAPQGASSNMPGGGSFPPPPPGPPPNAAPAVAHGKAEEAAGGAAAAQQAGSSSFPPPPPGPPPNVGPAMVQWKQEEAAREAAANSQENAPPPPSYTELDSGHPAPPPPQAGGSGQTSDLPPPAYVDDGQPKPGVGDSKTGRH